MGRLYFIDDIEVSIKLLFYKKAIEQLINEGIPTIVADRGK